MRLSNDLLKKEVIDSDMQVMGKVTDVVIDDDTMEIIDLVVKKAGIVESVKSNGENLVPIEIVKAIGDKILLKSDDDI